MKVFKNALLSLIALIAVSVSVNAGDFNVAVTTFNPAGSAGEFTSGGYPNATGARYINQLVITNLSATAQQINVYDTCTSSSAATLNAVFSAPSTGTYTFTFPTRQFKLTSPCINKSSTGSTVYGLFVTE